VPLEVIPCPVDLTRAGADVPELLTCIREAGEAADMPVVMVVIDTLSRAMQGADENAPADMTAFVGNIDRLRTADDLPHVLIVHHTGKDLAKGSRGHSSLRAATDTEIEIVLVDDAGDGKAAVARVKKQRDMVGENVFPFTIKSVRLGQDTDGASVTAAVVEHLGEMPGKEISKTKAPKPKERSDQALDILTTLVQAEGSVQRAKGIPSDTRVLPFAKWRDAVFVGDPDESASAKRKRWQRINDKLAGLGPHSYRRGLGLA
jgi:hypothetical protein